MDTIANLEYTPLKFLIQLDLATSGLKEKHFQIPWNQQSFRLVGQSIANLRIFKLSDTIKMQESPGAVL